MGFAGGSQHGKSVILQNIALRLAEYNDDICVLFWALDDSRERTYERLLSMHSGVSWKSITRRQNITDVESNILSQSIQKISELIRSGKLILKDHTTGSALPLLKRWIELVQNETDKPIVVVIDSFHKISSTSNESGMSEAGKSKVTSQTIKSMIQTHNITLLASLEVNKGASRGIEPDLLNITESRKIEFDFDILATVFNHYYDMDGDSDQIIMDGLTIKPIIKVNIRKSKDGGSGPIYFTLDRDTFRIKDYTIDEIKLLTGKEVREIKNIITKSIEIQPPDKGNLQLIPSGNEPWD